MDKPKIELSPQAMAAKAERDARKAEALRANLRKRKQQAREREAESTPPADQGD